MNADIGKRRRRSCGFPLFRFTEDERQAAKKTSERAFDTDMFISRDVHKSQAASYTKRKVIVGKKASNEIYFGQARWQSSKKAENPL